MTIAFNQFQAVAAQLDGRGPEPEPIGRFVDVPSVEPTADGWVGFATNGSAQFRAFAEMVGHPEWADHPELGRVDRRGEHDRMLRAEIATFTTAHTTDEVLHLASERRIPVAPLGNGETLPGFAPFVEREVFVEHPDGTMVEPRVPYRLSGAPTRPFGPVAPLGADTEALRSEAPHTRVTRDAHAGETGDAARPLAGLRVFDFTSYWAGPYAAQILGFLGADVVKVESVQRPDGTRMGTTYSSVGDRPWELAPLFHGANTNEREVTLDFTQPEGLALARRLLATCDVLIENYTPRVVERFGLLDDDLWRANPGLVVLRMPAWGLDGAWRDRPGFAQTMEQVTGLAWVTGHEGGAPIVPRGPCDPLGGLHAVFALLTALEHRDRTGEGMVVEAPLVESALNVAAEQVAVYRATGELLGREGNRSRFAAPQNVYRVGDGDRWLALAVQTDEQWSALRGVLGDPAWARDPRFADAAGRRATRDAIDQELAAAFATADRDELVARLCDAGVPVAPVVNPRVVVDNEQHAARGFYEPVVHPVAGKVRIPGFPAVWDVRDAPWHRPRRAAARPAQRRGAGGAGGRRRPARDAGGRRRDRRPTGQLTGRPARPTRPVDAGVPHRCGADAVRIRYPNAGLRCGGRRPGGVDGTVRGQGRGRHRLGWRHRRGLRQAPRRRGRPGDRGRPQPGRRRAGGEGDQRRGRHGARHRARHRRRREPDHDGAGGSRRVRRHRLPREQRRDLRRDAQRHAPRGRVRVLPALHEREPQRRPSLHACVLPVDGRPGRWPRS